jgi:tetratricopeptide (TPR) repeat protein
LGILFQELGNFSRAETFLQQGLELARAIGDEAGVAYLLSNLGLTQLDAGNLDAAEQALAAGLALVLAQDEHDKYQAAVFLSYQSAVSLQAGRLEQASLRASEALQMRRETGLLLMTTDDLATLAATHLAGADTATALDYARQALAILDDCGGDGPEFPQRDYFTCYQVLAAAGQREAAQTALQSAYNLVMARANKIIDTALRQSFLEKAAFNQEIVAAHQQSNSSG